MPVLKKTDKTRFTSWTVRFKNGSEYLIEHRVTRIDYKRGKIKLE